MKGFDYGSVGYKSEFLKQPHCITAFFRVCFPYSSDMLFCDKTEATQRYAELDVIIVAAKVG